MGVAFSDLIPRKPLDLSDLAGKRIAIDAFNAIFQFVAIIRNQFTGQPLRNHQGLARVTESCAGAPEHVR
jgi:flap endonuclease-1